jgi:ribosomal-protein-alanine N-acetyltransferase
VLERFSIGHTGPVLRGGKVVLRGATPGDWPAWARLRAESRDFLRAWEPASPADALTRAAFRRRLRHHQREARDESGFSFLVFRAIDDALVGGVTLSNVRRGVAQCATLGYWMGRPYAGRGYMGDAVRATLRLAFDTLRLHRVEAACLTGNERSRKLLTSLGFSEEGVARDYLCIDGRWQDHVLYGLVVGDKRP